HGGPDGGGRLGRGHAGRPLLRRRAQGARGRRVGAALGVRGDRAGGGLRADQLRSRPSRLAVVGCGHSRVSFTLCLTEDRLGSSAGLALPPTPRVLYARNGALKIESTTPTTTSTAWHGVGDVVVAADAPAVVLRFELIAASKPDGGAPASSESRRLLEHPIDLDRARAWLMRCDRVDFAPGGVALPHGHKGGGIRCLLAGTLEVTVGDRPPRLMLPGDAWFESGREPVLAKASPE